jgi:UPF0716 protein FxsA
MLARLLVLFTVVPIVELVLLVWLGTRIGFLPTVALIIVTAVVGALLARREGVSAWNRFQQRIARGELPGRELTDGLIVLVSGALLLTPGVLTDVVGLLGLFPASRAFFRSHITRAIERGVRRGTIHMATFGGFTGAPPSQSTFGPAAAPRGEEEAQDVRFEEFDRDPRRRPR